jgi:hypothetical protein
VGIAVDTAGGGAVGAATSNDAVGAGPAGTGMIGFCVNDGGGGSHDGAGT